MASRVIEVLALPEPELMDGLKQLMTDLPTLAANVADADETVKAWEAVLGAAMAEGLAEDQSDNPTQTEDNNEEDMLKKLLEMLASLGIIQAEDPEDVVLNKLHGLKEEMEWKREEMERQKAVADKLRASLPAANVADIDGEALPLCDDLVTVAANEITELREARNTMAEQRDAMREALADSRLEELAAANEITGAEVDRVRAELVACNDVAGMDEVISKLRRKPESKERVSAKLEGAKEKVIASNEAAVATRTRKELVDTHLSRIMAGKAGKPTQRQYDAAHAAARQERPELF